MTGKIFSYWDNTFSEAPVPLKHGQKDLAAVIGWGGVRVLDPEINIVELCCEYAEAMMNSSCGRCIPCRIGTKRIAEMFLKIRDGKGGPAHIRDIETLATTVSAASLCEIGQSSPLVLLYLLEHFRDAFEKALKTGVQKSTAYSFKSIVTAPCMQACPIHLDIPAYVEAIQFGRFTESLNIIKQRLPLPGVVGRVCVRPCEFNCRRGLVDEPIQIKHLKRFVADRALDTTREPKDKSFYELSRTESPYPVKEKPNGIKVAVVGAGPAGLTCAHFLALKGYDVTVFEMLPEPGGMAAVGIPDYRLPREILRGEVKAIEELGVKMIYGKALGSHFTLDDLDNDSFRAVFIGMGCHCHKSMGIEGEDKGYKGYVPGVYFLRNINLGLLDEIPKGKKIVVVGGGNVAIDCVRTAFRVGFEEAHLVYRRSRKEMPADAVEINDAEAEGVQYHFQKSPKKIIARNGKVTGLECLKMELGEPDASGRRRPVEVPGSEFIIEADVIVAAIGQEGDVACFCNLPGVEVTKKGAIVINEHFMTDRAGVFSAGDCVTGPDVLIRACAHGRLSAMKIERYLTEGKLVTFEEQEDEKFIGQLKVFDPKEKIPYPSKTPRIKIKHEPPIERRTDFREAEKGFTTEEAVAEAGRCLRCYRVVTYAYKEMPG